MNIGIVGLGVVGSACKFGFELIGHTVSYHDTKDGTSITDVKETDICFICVPTPSNSESGQCDTSIVESVVNELNGAQYKGLICIKSTVEPGTTNKLKTKYPTLRLAMVPEFLRERCAIPDFTENHDLLVIGTDSQIDFKITKEAHGDLPKEVVKLKPSEAELVKYFNNCYNATLITFANAFSEACKIMGVDYSNVMNCVSKRDHISRKYLQCNESFKGFGGMCLPKDMRALFHICKDSKVSFFSDILKQNKKFKTTILEGMRGEDE
jgi:UDPglucose 6-dehydrogenase